MENVTEPAYELAPNVLMPLRREQQPGSLPVMLPVKFAPAPFELRRAFRGARQPGRVAWITGCIEKEDGQYVMDDKRGALTTLHDVDSVYAAFAARALSGRMISCNMIRICLGGVY